MGIDLVSVTSIQAAVDAHGDAYLRRVYTEAELSACGSAGASRTRRLAGCFAAKEAIVKILAVAEEPFAWTDIEVLPAPAGRIAVTLGGAAARMAEGLGLRNLTVSLSGDSTRWMAVAVAEAS